MIDQMILYILSIKTKGVLNLIFDGDTKMQTLSFSFFFLAVTQQNNWDVCWAFLSGALPLGS